jgi:hypothetical protein
VPPLPVRIYKKIKKERAQKEKKKKKRKGQKERIKREGAALLSFIPHLCLCLAPILQFGESFHIIIHITMWGTLHYRTWLVYSNDEPPQKCSRSS